MKPRKHTIIALAQNKPGVLNRIFSLFRRRRFNVESITAGYTEIPDVSRITLTTTGTEKTVEQITKQMYKILEVVKVSDVTDDDCVIRELALVKVATTMQTRNEIIQLVDIFRGRIVDVAHNSLTLEITGTEEKIDSLFELLKKYGIKEMARTGRTAMVRGGATTKIREDVLQ